MATMNFSIPDDIKERFNRMFADRNKSAIVAQLLDEAVAREERKQQSDQAHPAAQADDRADLDRGNSPVA